MGQRREIKKTAWQMKMEIQHTKTYIQDGVKTVLKGKFIAMHIHLNENNISQINNLTLYIKN